MVGTDLLVFDLGLSDKDGLEVLEEIRGQKENLAVIILTARDDINDKVAGLGGDFFAIPIKL